VRSYELVFIVHPELDEDDLTAVMKRVTGLVERNSGQVSREEPWGLRRLAYPIEKWRGWSAILDSSSRSCVT